MSGGNPEKQHHIGLIIAVVGAIATLGTACITSFFGFLPALLNIVNQNTDRPVVVAAPTATLVQAAPTATQYLAPTATSQPVSTPEPLYPLLFASKVAANGQALDPGLEFKSDISELYAVFPAGMIPPGTTVSADDPQEGKYYAFLRVKEGGTLSRIGWRWIQNGKTVNDYEFEVTQGNDIWLSYANPEEGGIFGNRPFSPGNYTIVIMLGGNAFLSADLVITP